MRNFKIEKEFNYNGYDCVVVGLSMGHRCGYIGIKKGNKLYGKDYDYINCEYDIDVHGGFTYGEYNHTGEYPTNIADDTYWIGFDCAHYMDGKDKELIKELNSDEETLHFLLRMCENETTMYKTGEYVESELIKAIDQIIKIGK